MLAVMQTTSVAIAHQATLTSQIKDVKVGSSIYKFRDVIMLIYFSLYTRSACNCSALAVSEECDQLTGTCTCQDSAQGLKCDGCDYGYIGRIYVLQLNNYYIMPYAGQVPNCERCHECFFEWDAIINDLRQRIADLQSQIRNLTQTYFNSTDEETISMEINYLLMDLWQANDSLNAISLQESSVDEIQQMIISVSERQSVRFVVNH